MARPFRLEFWTVGNQKQNPGIADPAKRLRHQLPHRRIEPVRILEDIEHWLPGGETEELID
jgi:hypothetical protein